MNYLEKAHFLYKLYYNPSPHFVPDNQSEQQPCICSMPEQAVKSTCIMPPSLKTILQMFAIIAPTLHTFILSKQPILYCLSLH